MHSCVRLIEVNTWMETMKILNIWKNYFKFKSLQCHKIPWIPLESLRIPWNYLNPIEFFKIHYNPRISLQVPAGKILDWCAFYTWVYPLFLIPYPISHLFIPYPLSYCSKLSGCLKWSEWSICSKRFQVVLNVCLFVC